MELLEKVAGWQAQGLFSNYEKDTLESFKQKVKEGHLLSLLSHTELSLLLTETDWITTFCTSWWRGDFSEIVASLAKCKSLQSIDFNSSQVTDDNINYIVKRSPKITSVTFNECPDITNYSLFLIATKLKFLQNLEIRKCYQIEADGLDHLRKTSSLRSLTIHEDISTCIIDDLVVRDLTAILTLVTFNIVATERYSEYKSFQKIWKESIEERKEDRKFYKEVLLNTLGKFPEVLIEIILNLVLETRQPMTVEIRK